MKVLQLFKLLAFSLYILKNIHIFYVLAFRFFLYSKKLKKILFMYLLSAFSYTFNIKKLSQYLKLYLLREIFSNSSAQTIEQVNISIHKMIKLQCIKTQKYFLEVQKLLENFWTIFFFKNDQFQTHIKRKTTTINFYVNENFHNIFEHFFFSEMIDLHRTKKATTTKKYF